jgi:hypothetical protein
MKHILALLGLLAISPAWADMIDGDPQSPNALANAAAKKTGLNVNATPWVVYGFSAVTGSTTSNNPAPNTNGLVGEVISLPYTVPAGKTLTVTAYGVQANDAAGTVVLAPFVGGGGSLANATALGSVSAQGGTVTINGSWSFPAGSIFNIAIINGQATGTFGWFASGTLQ